MGLRRAFRKLWRAFHFQDRAMSQREIDAMDRAVSESMAKGSFGTRRPAPGPGPVTGDKLWEADDHSVAPLPPGSSRSGGGGGDRLMSMSSHRSAGRVSVVSSRGHDSGYGEPYYRNAFRRQYYQPQQPYYYQHTQDAPHWHSQYERYQPYEYDEEDYYEQYPYDQGQAYPRHQHGAPMDGYTRGPYVPTEAAYDVVPVHG